MPSGQRLKSNNPVISATSACSRTSPSAVIAGVHAGSGSRWIAAVTAGLFVGKPTEYTTLRPRS
jgi:hypothetical protein